MIVLAPKVAVAICVTETFFPESSSFPKNAAELPRVRSLLPVAMVTVPRTLKKAPAAEVTSPAAVSVKGPGLSSPFRPRVPPGAEPPRMTPPLGREKKIPLEGALTSRFTADMRIGSPEVPTKPPVDMTWNAAPLTVISGSIPVTAAARTTLLP